MEMTFVNRIISVFLFCILLFGCHTENKDPYPVFVDRGFIELNELSDQPKEFLLNNRTKDFSINYPASRLFLTIDNQDLPEDLYMRFEFKNDTLKNINWKRGANKIPKTIGQKKILYYYDCYGRDDVLIGFYTKSSTPIKNLKIEWILW